MQEEKQGCIRVAPLIDEILDTTNVELTGAPGNNGLVDRFLLGNVPDPFLTVAAGVAFVPMLRQVVYKLD